MNTATQKFVNAIASDLEEGGFQQVSGTTLRRTLTLAVNAALPLLRDHTAPDEQYADEQALIDHLEALMDDGGQGDEKWAPAQAAIAGILAARQVPALTFAAFRNANVSRCEKWHPEGIGSWSPSDWLTAAMGELGELASEVKMHNRVRDGLAGNKEQITRDERTRRMANEAADVVTYLDLFCAERGIDLGAALVRKFNEVSERVGFSDRLPPGQPAHGIDLHRLVPPEWISEQIGGPIDDLTPGQAWRQGFNQCRDRALLLVEQAMGFPAEQQRDAAPGVGS